MARARDLGFACDSLPTGVRNSIADVPGVRVGHTTLLAGDVRTGVTAILPHDGDLFRDKVVAAAVVLNGFGKSTGLVQMNELGTLETPILLTNTFAVGTCVDALIRRAVAENPGIGRQTSTVNPVVLECNDGYLNDIQVMAVTEGNAIAAIEAARGDFAVGAVGAGTGMSCFGLKGGIGSSSRRILLDGDAYHLGVLVLANFGRAGDLRLPDECSRAVIRGRLLHHRYRHRCAAGASPAWPSGATCRRRAGVVRFFLGQRQRRYRAGVYHGQSCAA
jgi:D-aminopeptidase